MFEEEKPLKKHNNNNYPYMSESKSDSVETLGKSSLFHCDECEYSYEEKKKLKNHEVKDHVSIINSKDSNCKNCGKDLI